MGQNRPLGENDADGKSDHPGREVTPREMAGKRGLGKKWQPEPPEKPRPRTKVENETTLSVQTGKETKKEEGHQGTPRRKGGQHETAKRRGNRGMTREGTCTRQEETGTRT